MAAKALLVLCAHALLIQTALSQCFNRGLGAYGWAGRGFGFDGLGYGAPYGWAGRGFGFDGLGYGFGLGYGGGFGCGAALDATPTSGGTFVVTSASAIPPTGISIVSDNVYDGILAVAGEVPFVGTTAMEGALPTAGAGAINYGCGTGVTAMVSDAGIGPAFGAGYAGLAPFGAGIGAGFGAGIATGIAPVLAPYGDCGCGLGYVY